MKRSSPSKNASLAVDPVKTGRHSSRKTFEKPTVRASTPSPAGSSKRKHVATKASHPGLSSSDSMTAIREDRITGIALWVLFGTVIVGLIYFLVLLLM